MAAVLFKFGNQKAYDSLVTRDSNALYFIEDTHRLYKGDVLMSEQVIHTDTVPEFDTAIKDRLYVVTQLDHVAVYVKGESIMVPVADSDGTKVAPGAIDDLNVFNEDVLAKYGETLTESNDKLVTEGAVKYAIDFAINEIKQSVTWQSIDD